MNALRFVIEGNGASTIVDGKDCPMEEGDLVITPGWTWHEHVHRGNAPIIWLDALDAPLHRYLGTDQFEPGPVHDLPNVPDDSAFAVPNIVPELSDGATPFSPVFRYPWKDARNAVRAAPTWKDGTRRVRYINPITGGSTMPLMDCYLIQLDKGTETVRFRTTSNAVCLVCEGRGTDRRRGHASPGRRRTCSACRTATGSRTRRTRPRRCSWSPTATRCAGSIF